MIMENNDMSDLEEINPYEVLKIQPTSNKYECKSAFRKLITSPNIEDKRRGSLAYDILCNKKRYIKDGNLYKTRIKDHFYYAIIGDLQNLKEIYKKNKNILKEKDELGRNLLYISARNGFKEICEFLLEEGMDPNETQNTKSTPLHGAVFYNQESTVELLLQYCANTNLKNIDKKTALEDAHSEKIKKILEKVQNDPISNLLNNLMDKKLAKKLILVKYKNLIIGKKILRNEEIMSAKIKDIINNWEIGWHGTKFEFLESIMKYGLYPSGTKLENGFEIKPLKGHVPLNTKVANIKDWARAIFVSPSIFYAGHPAYAKTIKSNGEEYSILVETRIKPNTYTEHKPTVVKYVQKNAEPTFVEYRIEVKDDSNLIVRTESEKNVVVIGLLFAKTDFLKNIKKYYEGEIYVNSKEEKSLFITD